MYALGIDPTRRTTEREFALNAVAFNTDEDDGATGWKYVQANGAIAEGALVALKGGQAATSAPAGNDNNTHFGVATEAFADDEYGWVQVYGASAVRAATSSDAYEQLYTHSTGDVDDATSTNAEPLIGIVLTTNSIATDHAITACDLNWPSCGTA